MYKNLVKTLDEMGLNQNVLLKVLGYGYQKKLNDRLSKNREFDSNEKELIYSFLKEKGYAGDKEFLFAFEKYVKETKQVKETRLSKILKARMKALKISNKELAELVGVEENTVSLWKTGKVETIKSRETLIRVCDVLHVSAGRLLGITSRISDEYVNEDFEIRRIEEAELKETIYNLLLNYQIETRGHNYETLKWSSMNPLFKLNAIDPIIDKFIIDINNEFDDRFSRSAEKLKILNAYKDYDSFFEFTTKKYANLSQQLAEFKNDPIKNKDKIAEVEREMRKTMVEFRRAGVLIGDDSSLNSFEEEEED